MDSRISAIDKITILYRTGIKFLRGGGTQNLSQRIAWNASCRKERADYSRKTYSLWKEC